MTLRWSTLFGQRDVRETTTATIVQANYNSTDFLVTNEVVALANKTSYYSIPATGFMSRFPASDANTYDSVNDQGAHTVESTANTRIFFAEVHVPHGAIVTGAVVFGNAAAAAGVTWTLYRQEVSTSGTNAALATANVDTEDTTISNATINNNTYVYFFEVGNMDINDEIDGGRVTYTTDYD